MIYLTLPIIAFFVFLGIGLFIISFASSHHEKETGFQGARKGCLLTLANIFLRPIPVIIAFYQFGFEAAIIVASVIWLLSRCVDVYKGEFWTSSFIRLSFVPLGASLTLYLDNQVYFQLIPSAWCVVTALQVLFALVRGKSDLFPNSKNETPFTAGETKLAQWGLLIACGLALLICEYVRHNLSLTGWIWYFSYLRLELLPIFLASLAPAMLKLFKRTESEPS